MKRLLILFIAFFMVVFTCTISAQEIGSRRGSKLISFPKKLQKTTLAPLTKGTYTVGISGYFPSIDSAFSLLSNDGIAGEVTLELIDTLYTAPEDSLGFFLNGPIPGASSNNRVIIKPAENKNVTIEGNSGALLSLINTSYVTFDGIGLTGATTLTIHTLENLSYDFNDPLDFIDNSDHNIIQNITFIVAYTRNSGTAFWGTGSFVPDSNLIQNNFVKQAGMAFFLAGSPSVKGKGNIIRGNLIGSETDSLIAYGDDAEGVKSSFNELLVTKNINLQDPKDDDWAYSYLESINAELAKKGLVALVTKGYYDIIVCKIDQKEELTSLFKRIKWDFVQP